MFVIAHISDLHFSEGTDKRNSDHTHSIEHLLGLQDKIPTCEEVDLLVVSGDISNHGDSQSLINASGYIFDTIPIGEGRYTGLRFIPSKVGIVPGNHDAWNASHTGSLIVRRQKSLENYNFAFKSHKIDSCGCYYDWLEKDGHGVYLAFVDSCFLGDTEDQEDSVFGTLRFDQTIAKGKLTIDQTEKLLEWHDQGVKGLLGNPRNKGQHIDKEFFSKAIKILVMHHYLFEPPGRKSNYFMRFNHRDIVFRNVALSDFDVLLCGHKHIPSFDLHTYGKHFDRRAINRYMVNYFRRIIGLHSLPIQFEENGVKWSKSLSLLINLLIKSVRADRSKTIACDSSAIIDEVLNLLNDGLENPDGLEKRIKNFLCVNGASGSEIFEKSELKEICKRISICLPVKERKRLKNSANEIMKSAKKLIIKPFLQIMSGSSAKACTNGNRDRTFNIYRFAYNKSNWHLKSERYVWDWDNKAYVGPILQDQNFSKAL